MVECSSTTQVWSSVQPFSKEVENQTMKKREVRPVPIRTEGTSAFFDSAKRGELILQHCRECNRFNLTGYLFCPYCLSATEWCHSEGLGRISSFSIVAESSHPGFKDLLPYAVAEVTLSEGPKLNLRIVGAKPENIFIGQQVNMDFLDEGGRESTPVWRVI